MNSNQNLHDQQFKQSLPQQYHLQSTPRNQHQQQQQQHLYKRKPETRNSGDRGTLSKASSASGACARGSCDSRRQSRRRSLPVETNAGSAPKDSESNGSPSFLVDTKGSRSLDTGSRSYVMNGGNDEEGANKNKYLDDDDDSLESLILERKMSMRRRKEKKQRRKLLRSGKY